MTLETWINVGIAIASAATVAVATIAIVRGIGPADKPRRGTHAARLRPMYCGDHRRQDQEGCK